MIQKTIIILLLGFAGGAGLFLSDVEIRDSFAFFNSGEHSVVKKKNLVKPKSFYSKRKPRVEGFKYNQLSFVPVLNDSSLSKMMGLNGQVIKKINYSPPAVRVSSPPKKKIREEIPVPVSPVKIEKAELKVTSSSKTPAVPKKVETVARQATPKAVSQILKEFPILFAGGDSAASETPAEIKPVLTKNSEPLKKAEDSFPENVSFVVQVSSFRTMQRAEVLRDALGKKGYASFIGKTELPNNKGTWYRVNIGQYLDHVSAKMAAANYNRQESKKAMVIKISG